MTPAPAVARAAVRADNGAPRPPTAAPLHPNGPA
jgi:hypothetical protein